MGWSEAVGPTGHVTALEFSPEYASIAEETFAKNSINNIEVIVGDARESFVAFSPALPLTSFPPYFQVKKYLLTKMKRIKTLAERLKEPYDLIFLDADKPSYPTYLSQILEFSTPSSKTRLLKQGGIIVADNVLSRGLSTFPPPSLYLLKEEIEAHPFNHLLKF
jgi:predicted O-methyltransferase YrrM